MHGLTHLTGGADPIPGLLPTTAPTGGAVFTGSEVYVTLSTVNWWQGVTARVQPTAAGEAGGAYTFAVNGTSAGIWSAVDAAGNVATPIATGSITPLTAGMKVGLTCVGDQIRGWIYSAGAWTNILSATDSSWASGYLGLWQVQQAGRLDDFGGGVSSDSVGTFATPILDGFDYPDEEPLSGGGNWTTRSPTPLKVVGGQVTQGGTGDHYAGATWTPALEPAGGEGDVLTVDGDGNPTWEPPGVTVEHGDGEPDPEPVTSPWTVSGGTSTSGWHLEAHVETAVLYDSSPGRFDVPSQKWVRVPFNTVRFWRRWEPTVGATNLKTEWLPDDRGLTGQARDGILHITAGMVGTPDIDGYHQRVVYWPFSPEWPFLDWSKLPNSPTSVPGFDPANIDAYVRAARAVDLSHGFVLRDSTAGPGARQFFEWDMWVPADGTPEWVGYSVDNPYPVYPVWADRPLVLPPPYPKLTEAQSGQYYAPQKTVATSATLAAGSNLCVQAWQDAPWLLRFSTDTYRIPYPGQRPKWVLRPHLAVSYRYDPETINHTTGKLL